MTRINLTFVGTTPLVCHNPRLADPDDEISKLIKDITSKRIKTEEDRREIERLEWFGGLYVGANGDGPVVPTGNLRKCLMQAAKIQKRGTQVSRALMFTQLNAQIQYDGSRDPEQMQPDLRFSLRLPVGVKGNRTMRVRPCFRSWRIDADAELMDDVMDLRDFAQVAEQAGRIEGLGDNRTNGYGRFTASVKAL